MKLWAKSFGVVVGAFLLLNGAAFLLIESGEIVVLRSDGENNLLARLWVVDHGGYPWVGTANPSKTRWVGYLRENPTIRFSRGDVTECRNAAFVDDRAIVASREGGLVTCPGGSGRCPGSPDQSFARPALLQALSWRAVAGITDRFERLNPRSRSMHQRPPRTSVSVLVLDALLLDARRAAGRLDF
jgi:hypothetical protein